MSQSVDASPKVQIQRGKPEDSRILAQVEKWMAMIREICRETAKS